ncbi:MAG: beta-hydroxyacyl-ACP dehydratase [Fibrobacter sp.]|nr:beta-hydroxyacyl-ACP dehydratase [Fibrobacter sp.]
MSLLESLPKSNKDGILYEANTVHNILPQKAPFAFVDEILSLDAENMEIVGKWHLTGEEGFLKGHFPGNPVLPGVIQIESMAQAATLLTMIGREAETTGKRPAFMGVENCRFRAPVIPPAEIVLKAKLVMAVTL